MGSIRSGCAAKLARRAVFSFPHEFHLVYQVLNQPPAQAEAGIRLKAPGQTHNLAVEPRHLALDVEKLEQENRTGWSQLWTKMSAEAPSSKARLTTSRG